MRAAALLALLAALFVPPAVSADDGQTTESARFVGDYLGAIVLGFATGAQAPCTAPALVGEACFAYDGVSRWFDVVAEGDGGLPVPIGMQFWGENGPITGVAGWCNAGRWIVPEGTTLLHVVLGAASCEGIDAPMVVAASGVVTITY